MCLFTKGSQSHRRCDVTLTNKRCSDERVGQSMNINMGQDI